MMIWEILAVWVTALVVPTVIVLTFLRSIKAMGVSAFDLIQKQLQECRDREILLNRQVETCQQRIAVLEAANSSPKGEKPLQVEAEVTMKRSEGELHQQEELQRQVETFEHRIEKLEADPLKKGEPLKVEAEVVMKKPGETIA